ncbi:hypothetical protein XELAEV_18034276mg [Xenopus laevis]|uniref:Shootin-1 n=1 Tax=Xenopus laevis TaxID=8355 RepID=A0A974HAY0_XENLA|nr:hypothetical protein XELAEV_18034276mg [Xenopus laevis]
MSGRGAEPELELLETLKEQAIEKYEELKTENMKTKDEYDKLRKERDDAVKKLEEFSKISHMVIEEVGFIQNNLEVEKSCRESAEALASKLNKENKTLKRISMLCMAKLGPDVITKEINLDEEEPATEAEAAVCTSLGCQQRIKELQEQVITGQEEKKSVTLELENLRSTLLGLIEEVNSTKKENVMLAKQVFEQRKLLDKCNRVSLLAVEEYEELQSSLDMEKDLRQKAESIAHEMYIEQNKLKRQSQLLLQNCAPDAQLLKALEENSRLTHLLEESKIQHQLKVKELEEELEEARLRKEVQSLKKQLELIEEEKRELEAKWQSSESAVKDLKHSGTDSYIKYNRLVMSYCLTLTWTLPFTGSYLKCNRLVMSGSMRSAVSHSCLWLPVFSFPDSFSRVHCTFQCLEPKERFLVIVFHKGPLQVNVWGFTVSNYTLIIKPNWTNPNQILYQWPNKGYVSIAP